MARRIIVTGASGTLGKACLARLLASGAELHAVSRHPPDAPTPGIHWHAVDLLAPDQRADLLRAVAADGLLHLAWETTPPHFYAAPANTRWLVASIDLIERFLAAGGKRFVGAGSCAEYSWREARLVENQTPLDAATLYGQCKAACGRIALTLAGAAGASAAWGRIFWMYGGAEHPARLVPHIIRTLLRGDAVPLTDGTQCRDYIHVADVGAALAALLLGEVSGAVNIGTGVPTSIGQIARTIATLVGRTDSLQFGALPRRADDPASLVAGTDRLVREVGCMPQVGLTQGLADSIAYWGAAG